jgi:hypothetical protein
MSGKTSVILPKGRPDFRRTMRDENGTPIKDDAGNERVLKFSGGQVVELTAEELEAVRDDIGPALQIAKIDKEEKPVPKPDGEATRKFVEETRKMRQKEAAERAAEKPEVVLVPVPAGSVAGVQARTAKVAQPMKPASHDKDK